MYGLKIATKDNILSLITEYDIFKYYITSFKMIGKAFCSELEKDKKPSCTIFMKDGKLYYKDFRDTETLNCFSYIMKKYNLTFYETLDLINRDFNLCLQTNTSKQFVHSFLEKEILLYGDNYFQSTEAKKEIKVELTNWNKGIHKRYWYDQYGLGVKDLNYFDIHAIRAWWVIQEGNYNYYISDPLSFGYYFDKPNGLETWKIYQPYAASNSIKWMGNTHLDTLQGFKQLRYQSDTLIITKSLKDVAVLYKLNYDSVAPNAESCLIDETKMAIFKEKYKHIVIIFDDDKAGIKGSTKLSEKYNIPSLFLPKDTAKDVSDYVASYGYDNLKNELINLINV